MARRGEGLYLRGRTWILDIRIAGIRHVITLGKGIKRSVASELADVKRAAILKGDAGIGKKKKDLAFNEAREKFEGWITTEKRPNTVRRYKQCLKRLAQTFAGKRLSEITPWMLEAYKKERVTGTQLTARPPDSSDREWVRLCRLAAKGSPIGVNRELGVLKTLFNRCKAWGLVEGENPACAVKLRKEPRTRLRWLSPEEEARLLAVAAEPLRSIILTGLHTGIRIQAEATQLCWEDIDLTRGHLTVAAAYAKNGRSRTVPLNSIACRTLKQLQQHAVGPFVFAKPDGSPYRSIRSAFQTACRRANLSGISPHTLRHTFGSRLAMAGADMRTIQEVGGWRTLGMVERYSHLAESHKADAVEKLAAISQQFSQQSGNRPQAITANALNPLSKLA
ncbi:MAG: tyrosine-type recombinase/integrase [Nitrospira sp.]